MKKREILTQQEAITSMLEGMNILADVVGCTLGPDGHTVYFNYQGVPISTKDGVTVAKLSEFDSAVLNMGAGVIRHAAQKAAEETGDGTTTAVILARAFITMGLEAIEKGANRRHIGNGIYKAALQVCEYILEMAKPIEHDDNEVYNVAYVSSNSDKEVAELISGAIKKLGREGVIKIVTSQGPKTYIEYIPGMMINTSYTTPSFINTHTGDVNLKNVALIIHDEDILTIDDFLPLMGQLQNMRPFVREDGEKMSIGGFVFIARSIDGEAHGSMVKSKLEKGLPICAVKAPYGLDFIEQLRDIAVMTGGKLIASQDGYSLRETKATTVIGLCDEVVINDKGMWIIGGKSRVDERKSRIELLRNQLEKEETQTRKKTLEERIGKLQNGVARMYVGGENESKMHERAFRVEDAISAVKSSMKEGIVPGAGTAYIRALRKLEVEYSHPDEAIGIDIVRKALVKPLEQILINSGFTRDPRNFIQKLFGKPYPNDLETKMAEIMSLAGNQGYNARTKRFEDLIFAGVIDPAMVERSSLKHAAAVAQQFLSTGGAIVNNDSHEKLLEYHNQQ